jgi:photoactive yellow protein
VTVFHAFDEIDLGALARMPLEDLDRLPFGVVGLDSEKLVVVYNATEAGMAGLARDSVIGLPFFDAVAQCMNNFMVAQRFEDEAELDEIVPYVLTLRMRPTRVRLRLLATPDAPLQYILIER